jgi:hypothetical protein
MRRDEVEGRLNEVLHVLLIAISRRARQSPERGSETWAQPPTAAAPRQSAAEVLLRETRPDELSSCEALDLLYRLKRLVAE